MFFVRCCIAVLGSIAFAVTPLFADEPAANSRPLVDGTTLVFASKDQAAEFLGQEDEYTKSLSGVDRRIRMQAAEDPGDEAFREHAVDAARNWSPEELTALNAAWDQVTERLKNLRAQLPEEVLMIRTSGAEESNAAYTRRNAIILPEKALARDPSKVRWAPTVRNSENNKETMTWVKGERRTELVFLDTDVNSAVIFKDLGINTFLGTPCDNV